MTVSTGCASVHFIDVVRPGSCFTPSRDLQFSRISDKNLATLNALDYFKHGRRLRGIPLLMREERLYLPVESFYRYTTDLRIDFPASRTRFVKLS